MSRVGLKIGLAATLLLLIAVTASAQTVSVESVSITPGETKTVNVVLDKVPSTGLSYVNMSVSITDPSVAEITDIEFPTWATLKDNSTLPSSTVWFKVGDLSDQVKAGDTNKVLATLKIKGLAEGTSDIKITVNSFQDDSYNEIKDKIATTPGTVTVSAVTPTPTPTPQKITIELIETTFKMTETGVDKIMHDKDQKITVKAYDVDEFWVGEVNGVHVSVLKYTLGDVIKTLVYNLDADETTTIEVIDAGTGDIKISKSFKAASKELSVDTSNLYPGLFYVRVSTTKNDKPVELNSSDPNKCYEGMVFIWLYATKPEIHISLENSRLPIVKGDNIIAKIKVYNAPLGVKVTYKIEGPIKKPYVDSFKLEKREMTVTIPTAILFTSEYGGTEGTYKLIVSVLKEIESIKFDIVDFEITFDVPTTAYLGTKIKFKGTVNIAETGSKEDDKKPENYVYVAIWLPNGTMVRYDGSLIKASEIDYTKGYYTRKCKVDSDGTWENDTKVLLDPSWDTGSYKVTALAVTTDTTINGERVYLHDDETIYINVKEPEIEFTMKEFTFARGEDFKFRGTATVEKGTVIVIASKDLDKLLDKNKLAEKGITMNKKGDKYYITTQVGADGTWETRKLYIAPDAPKMSYTIDAIIAKDKKGEVWSDWKDTITIRVVKAKLDANISRTSAPRGGEIVISGTTTLDYVYIYADDYPVLENVGDIPSDTEKFNADEWAKKDVRYKPYKVKVEDNKFSVKLEVDSRADVDTYTIYVIAPANPPEVDPTEDAMAQFSLTVTEFGFSWVPKEIRMVKGDEIDVYVKVNCDPDDVKVTGEFHGQGARVDEDEFGEFSKHNETEDGGWVYATIYPFYNDTLDKLVSEGEPDELLRPGMYTLTIHMYNRETGEEISEAETTIPVIVEEPVLNVDVPSEVKKGEPIVVKIDTNRGEKGYDYLYVVLDLGVKKMKYTRIALDENGDAEVEIPTAGISTGTYKLYVRDAMRTLPNIPNVDIEKWYDIDPTDSYAKYYNAQDDILWVGEVKIVEAAVTTPTTVTTNVTATVTTPTVTTTTTTPVTTTTTTVTTTTTTTAVTTTTTPKKPTPGFEAIFAIAGLIAVAYLLRRR